ncbi:MAG: class I SAM-dependent methyltransferase [Polyangiaceae bacterium]|jgi:23S rRNA (cytosine1962-C5)-methyltransferase
MDRARVWPDFRESWIVYEDSDVMAIDKPVGVSSQAADEQRPDDLVGRLKRYLALRGEQDYLGVHQRLDRDTSGLVLMTRRREVNADVAAQFEGRRVVKSYLACVSGWPRGRDRVTLQDGLARGKDGRSHVVSSRSPGAKAAVTQVRCLARRGDRAMLELDLRTGRTHQARAQLAHVGSPIGGDPLYGGARAPRLMLHACALALTHPTSGRRLDLAAAAPAEFAAWLDGGDAGDAIYDDDATLDLALEHAVERRWGLGRSDLYGADRTTTAFRLVNEDGDAMPRLAVDVYGAWLVAQFYGTDGPWADAARKQRVLDRLGALGFDGVYVKVRPKQANLLVDTRRVDIAPPHPARGAAAPEEFSILEEGVPLLVRLGDGLSTGLFLDQRSNRRRVRDLAAGKSFANLFSYTCAFTVCAALGGSSRTVSVDASLAALDRGRANLAHAGVLQSGDHALVVDDVFTWLARVARRGERFDIVALDPPSYSTTRKGRFVADEDYGALAAAALAVLGPGGRLLACTNHRGISASRFRRILFEACRQVGREPTQVKDLPEPADFPAPPGGAGHMKSALVTLAG